ADASGHPPAIVNEADVMRVASAWSIDPTTLDGQPAAGPVSVLTVPIPSGTPGQPNPPSVAGRRHRAPHVGRALRGADDQDGPPASLRGLARRRLTAKPSAATDPRDLRVEHAGNVAGVAWCDVVMGSGCCTPD